MVNTVGGLRSIQSERPRPTYDRGQRPIDTGDSRPVQVRPVATPVNRYSGQPNDQRLLQLAEALSKLNPALKEFGVVQHDNKLQQQKTKFEAYAEQIKRDMGNGKITAVQVGEMFPETVPSIRMALAEAHGERAGKELFSKVIERINTDENLRFNNDARRAVLTEERAKIAKEYGGGGNDFYTSGLFSAFDKSTATWEQGWEKQAADKDMEVMGEKFGNEAEEALLTKGEGELLDVDARWAKVGGLHHTTRNKILVERITQKAYDSNDSGLLDRIPTRFLSNETKQMIARSKAQIEQKARSDWQFDRTVQQYVREEDSRTNKLRILQGAASGKYEDPRQFSNDPEAYEMALNIRNRDYHTTPQKSAARSAAISQGIMLSSTFGSTEHLGIPDKDFNLNGLTKAIMADPDLTNKEAAALIEQLPKLLEGTVIMESPTIKQMFAMQIKPQLDALDKSALARIGAKLGGIKNIHSETNKVFMNSLGIHLHAEFKDTGSWPTQKKLIEITQQAIEDTNNYLIPKLDIRNIRKSQEDLKADSQAPTPASASSAPASAAHPKQAPTTTRRRGNG